MAITKEWDPFSGTWTTIRDHHDGGLVIKRSQDPKAALDWAKKQRNSGVNDLGGARDGADFKHYAVISQAQIMKMREKGIDIWNKDHTQKVIKEIETNYPLCKVTNRKLF